MKVESSFHLKRTTKVILNEIAQQQRFRQNRNELETWGIEKATKTKVKKKRKKERKKKDMMQCSESRKKVDLKRKAEKMKRGTLKKESGVGEERWNLYIKGER